MRYPKTRAIAAISAALLAAGCGSDDGSSPSGDGAGGSGDSALNVAYISYAYTDYVQAEEEGLKEIAEGSGGSVRMFNANFDAQKLLKDCQDAVSSGRYNAIVLAPVDPATGVPCATAAAAADIPVVTTEIVVGDDMDELEPQVDGVVGVVGITPERNAEPMIQLLEEACADLDPCKVIGEVASPSDPLTTRVLEEAEKLPNVELVQTISAGYDPATVAKAFPDALSANPDAHVFVSAADSQALAVVPVLESAGKLGQIKLIGNGGSRLGAKAVADGVLFGTAGNWPRQMGVAAGEMLLKAIKGETIEEPAVDALKIAEPQVLTADTVGEFEAEWGAERPGG